MLNHLQSHLFSVTADQFCIKTQNNNISNKMLHYMQRNLMQIKHTHTLHIKVKHFDISKDINTYIQNIYLEIKGNGI